MAADEHASSHDPAAAATSGNAAPSARADRASHGEARGGSDRLAGVVERNIEALIARRQHEDRSKPTEERVADAITHFAGSMRFVYLHLVLFGTWIVLNVGLLPVKPFDPSLVLLAMFASVEAIFLSTFVLISQNRMAILEDKRAELDLQVSLLAEHEVTRLIDLVSQIAQKVGIDAMGDPEIAELAQDVAPEHVLDKMEEVQRKANDASG